MGEMSTNSLSQNAGKGRRKAAKHRRFREFYWSFVHMFTYFPRRVNSLSLSSPQISCELMEVWWSSLEPQAKAAWSALGGSPPFHCRGLEEMRRKPVDQ